MAEQREDHDHRCLMSFVHAVIFTKSHLHGVTADVFCHTLHVVQCSIVIQVDEYMSMRRGMLREYYRETRRIGYGGNILAKKSLSI